MQTLLQLVKGLTPSEKRLMRKFYNLQPNGEDKKRLKLFDLVVNNKVSSNSEASNLLYNSPPNSAFSHTKKRLKKNILDFLLMQDASKHYTGKIKQLEMNVGKWALQGELLLARGIYDEGEKLLKKALEKAELYEIFSEVIRIKNLLRTSAGFRRGLKEFDKYSDNMDYYIREYDKLLKVREYNYKIKLPNQFFTNKQSTFMEFSSKALEELEELHKGGSSVTFTFQYYLLRVFYADQIKDFDTALEYGEKLIHIVTTEPIYKDSEVSYAGINMVLSDVYLKMANYEKAIYHSNIAVKTFTIGMINELRAMEYAFFAYIRMKDNENARKVIEKALEHRQANSNKMMKARWNYFMANLEYLSGNKESASNILREHNDLLKDKSGWLLGFKLLELMILIDEDEYYLVSFQLNNFTHLLSRMKGENVSRAKIISQILRSLSKHRGRFNDTISAMEDKLKLLNEGKDEYHWDPKGYEVIRFDEWFQNKAKTNR